MKTSIRLLIVAGQHGDEPRAFTAGRALLHLFRSTPLVKVAMPSLHPTMDRLSRGVDLNRMWGAAELLAPTQGDHKWLFPVDSDSADYVIDIHAQSGPDPVETYAYSWLGNGIGASTVPDALAYLDVGLPKRQHPPIDGALTSQSVLARFGAVGGIALELDPRASLATTVNVAKRVVRRVLWYSGIVGATTVLPAPPECEEHS